MNWKDTLIGFFIGSFFMLLIMGPLILEELKTAATPPEGVGGAGISACAPVYEVPPRDWQEVWDS